jgi:hypothetical protein
MKKSITLMVLVLFLGSCIKDITETADKIQNIDGIQWNPTIAAPLVYSRLQFEDLLGQVDVDQYLRIESDGSMTLIYGDEYTSETAEEILGLDDQNFSETFTLSPAQLSTLNTVGEVKVQINRNLGYGFGANELDKLWFKNGSLAMNLTTTLEHDVSLSFKVKEGLKNGLVFTPAVDAIYTSLPNTGNSNTDMEGLEIDFTKTAQGHSEMEVDIELTITKKGSNIIKPVETISYTLDLINQAYQRADGLFIDIDFSAGGDTLRVPFFDNSAGGSFTLADPRVKFVIENSIGIPLNARITKFEGTSVDNSTLALVGIPDPLPVPIITKAEIGLTKKDSFELNKNTSNLADYVNNRPAKNVYLVEVKAGGTGARHSVLDTSKIKGRVEIEVPLEGTARDYALEVTQPFDLNLDNVEQIKEVMFRLYTENGFPIDVQTQLYFEDSMSNTVLDSLFGSDILILPSGNIDAGGRVISANPKTIDATKSSASIDRIKDANRIRIRAAFNTPFGSGGIQPDVKFYKDYNILLQLGVQAEVLIKQEF